MSKKLRSEPESILVVDDDISVRTIFSSFLKKEGYRVTAVKDGSEAVKAIDEGSFDLALVDLRMPWLDGIEVLGSIKNRKPQIPVIIYTGSGSVATAVEAMRKGAADSKQLVFNSESKKKSGNIIKNKGDRKNESEENSDVGSGACLASFAGSIVGPDGREGSAGECPPAGNPAGSEE